MTKKRGENSDTAFSQWWIKHGNSMATLANEVGTPLYQVMKSTFYWGWEARGKRDRRAASAGAEHARPGK